MEKQENLGVSRFFDEKQIETFLYDTFQKTPLELFESLKIYIERNGTPFNYLEPEDAIKCNHFAYYENMNSKLLQNKYDRELE